MALRLVRSIRRNTETRFPHLCRIPNQLEVRVVASRGEPFVMVEFKLGGDLCQVCTRPRSGSRGWKGIHCESVAPRPRVPHDPSSESTEPPASRNRDPSSSPAEPPASPVPSLPVPPRAVCLGFASDSTQPDPPRDMGDYSEGSETDDESTLDLSGATGSDPPLRNLSSAATLSTYAANGCGNADFPADFPYEIEDIPTRLDGELEHTPILRGTIWSR